MTIEQKASKLLEPNYMDILGLPVPKIQLKRIGTTNHLLINSHVALPVVKTSTEFDTTSGISTFDPNGNEIGTLAFTSSMTSFNLASLTDDQLVAYLTEIDLDKTRLGDDYQFENNYFIVKKKYLSPYLRKYFSTAPLWGRFSHVEYSGGISKSAVTTIHIKETSYSAASNTALLLTQAVAQPYSAERFLKLYHVLESDFDYVMVKKLRDLNLAVDAHKMGELINGFSRLEFDRLYYLIESKVTNFSELAASLNAIIPYQTKAETIFYVFGKSTNPLKELNDFRRICSGGGFGLGALVSVMPSYGRPNAYNTFICKLCANWIYRIRCCIAHNKVGEYVLEIGDEDFIVKFAEPLLRTVLLQYLS